MDDDKSATKTQTTTDKSSVNEIIDESNTDNNTKIQDIGWSKELLHGITTNCETSCKQVVDNQAVTQQPLINYNNNFENINNNNNRTSESCCLKTLLCCNDFIECCKMCADIISCCCHLISKINDD
ncbi:hypothetical protein HCN44_003020 [Aphidius gifuensis]|uniref:Uncharacterized protein n=1 Tax=Aphidius gifuensis TaxID=684658 RepID=A0A835CMM4_APHGI|nr:uncharacterized protein LOC122859317 [Aphidius gifuensis]KAF7987258.1 hypothetical protein HCN44_003020 [Aphidius gifuensis]